MSCDFLSVLFMHFSASFVQGGCARRVVSRTYRCTSFVTRGVCKVCIIVGLSRSVIYISFGLYSNVYFMHNSYFIFSSFSLREYFTFESLLIHHRVPVLVFCCVWTTMLSTIQ